MPSTRPAKSPPRRIRILVAGEQEIDRESLAALLARQPDLTVVGCAATTVAAVTRCRRLRPHVLVLDGRLAGIDGLPAVTVLARAAPGARLLAIAERSRDDCLVLNPPGRARPAPAIDQRSCPPAADCLLLALARGAHGAIRRSASTADLLRAIRALAAGAAWIEPGTAARLTEALEPTGGGDPLRKLSVRDLEVAALVADGRSNKEIACATGVAEQTVKKHVGRLLLRLGLADRLQLGLYFARHPQFLAGTPPPS